MPGPHIHSLSTQLKKSRGLLLHQEGIFVLHSLDPPCSQVSQSSDYSQPCTLCRMLHNHNIIMGIRHRVLDGAKERTLGHILAQRKFSRHSSARTKSLIT